MVTIKELESRLTLVERQVKRIQRTLEMSDVVHIDSWKHFTALDKQILTVLSEAGRGGISTTQIALKLNLDNPYKYGRIIVWKRLRRIVSVSERLKGVPMVISRKKRWFLNLDDFQFAPSED